MYSQFTMHGQKNIKLIIITSSRLQAGVWPAFKKSCL